MPGSWQRRAGLFVSQYYRWSQDKAISLR